MYQGAHLNIGSSVTQVEERWKQNALSDLDNLNDKMKERLEWSNSKLLRSLLVFLETQIWINRSTDVSADNLSDDEDMITTNSSLLEVENAVEHIATHFRKPFNGRGLLAFSLPDEVEKIVEYARTYLSISQTPYRKV